MLAEFTYDGLGRLIQTTRHDRQENSETEAYYYDGVRRIQEIINPDTTPSVREYVYGPDYVDEPICQIDETGDLYYILLDANYNVMALVDTDGYVVAQYQYEPYGNVAAADDLSVGQRANQSPGPPGPVLRALLSRPRRHAQRPGSDARGRWASIRTATAGTARR